MWTPAHESPQQLKDNPKAVALQMLDGTFSECLRSKEKSCPSARTQMVKMQPMSIEIPGASNYQKIREGQHALSSVTDDRRHVWAPNPNAAHEVSSGQAPRAKPGRPHYTSGFCPSMNYHSLSALHSAFFKQAILNHQKCFGGNHRKALNAAPKITSGRGKGQRGGACRPFCKSFKYPGIDPIKKIMKGKQPNLSFSH